MTNENKTNEAPSKEMYMQADSVEQVNVNHQANMSLCVESISTQTNIRFELASGRTESHEENEVKE